MSEREQDQQDNPGDMMQLQAKCYAALEKQYYELLEKLEDPAIRQNDFYRQKYEDLLEKYKKLEEKSKTKSRR